VPRQKPIKSPCEPKPSPTVEVGSKNAQEIPILSNELELLDGHLDEVIAYVVKNGRINGE